jgi:hypothetical protein
LAIYRRIQKQSIVHDVLLLWNSCGNSAGSVKPADIPVEQPTKFDLVLQLQVAAPAPPLTTRNEWR